MPVAIVGWIAAAGVGGLVSAAGTLTAIGNILAGVIGIGISLGINALFGAKPTTIKPQDGKGLVRQSVAPRTKHYGRIRSGGSLLAIETQNGNLHQIAYQGEGPVDGFEEWYVDDRLVALDVNGFVQAEPYNGKVRILWRKGLPTETYYADMAAAFPTIWGPSYRGDGMATAYITAFGVKQQNFNSVYPNRLPTLNSVRRGCPVYDPRSGVRAWSENLPLILREFLTDSDGAQIDASYIEDNDFKTAADVGDEVLITNGGGTVSRYHGQLSYSLDAEPGDTISKLLIATDGRLFLRPSGKIGYLAGKWYEPTVSIPDGALAQYELSDGSGPLREANEVTVKYTNVLSNYSEGTITPWRDEDDVSLSGQVKSIPIEAYEIQNHHHGRRVAKLKSRRSNPRWQGTITTDLRGMEAWDQRFIRVQVLDLGIDFESFEVKSIQEGDDDMTVVMEIVSMTAEAYELTSDEEGTPPLTPVAVSDDVLNAPDNLVVIGGQRAVSGSNKIAVITATWDLDEDRDDLTARPQISLADADSWSDMVVSDTENSAEAIGLVDGALYDVQVGWLGPGGAPGPKSLIENIRATADPAKPGTPQDPQQSVSGLTVTISARAANDNTAYFEFFRALSTQSFASATNISGDLRVSANQVMVFDDNPGVGTYRYWVLSKNGSGVVADVPAGPISAAVV